MGFIFKTEKGVIATERIKCDATEMFWEIKKGWTIDQKMKYVEGIFSSRFTYIEVGEIYTTYEFVDGDTGEFSSLNFKNEMDAYMRKHNLFPEYIPDEIKNKITHGKGSETKVKKTEAG